MKEQALQRPDQSLQSNSEQQESKASQQAINQKPNKTGIPDALKASIEAMSGLSLDAVRVHYNSDKPALMNAHAYAEGLNVYIASGQEKHLAHELWHVVQQMRKEVSQTIQLKEKKGANENSSLERKAEQEGTKARQMAKIPDLLPQQQLEKRDISQEVVQRVRKEAETHYGAFAIDDNDYKFDKNEGTQILHIDLEFTPNENANATKVGLTQVVKAQNNGQRSILEPHQEQRMTKNNYHVDQMSENRNPLYATDAAPEENQDQLAAYKTTNGDHAIKEGDTWTSAKLIDEPSVEGLVSSVRKFETAALAIEGEDKGKYYGSVQWGFQKVAGKSSKIEFKLVSKGVPSKNFMQAAEKWNNSKARGTGTITKDTMVMNQLSIGGGGFQFEASGSKLKKGEQVKIAEGNVHGTGLTGKQYIKVSKIGGKIDAYTDSGYINIKHFKDNGDGEEVIPLPLVNVMINKKTTELYENQDQSGTSTPLAKKTRMEIIDNEGEELVKVRIVDGDNITQEGWIESAQLSAE